MGLVIDLRQFQRQIHPIRKSVVVPKKGLFGMQNGIDGKHKRTKHGTGWVCEMLESAITGGIPYKRDGLSSYCLMVEPDLTVDRSGAYIETKSISSGGGSLMLKDAQTARYALLQLGEGVYDSPTIYYALYHHNSRGIAKRTNGNLKKIIDEVCGEMVFRLQIPFSIIWKMYKQARRQHNPLNARRAVFTEWEEGRNGKRIEIGREELSRIRLGTLYELISNPEDIIKTLGLNPDDYEFERRKMPYTKKRKMNFGKTPVPPFPSLAILDKNHLLWLRRFKQGMSRKRREELVRGIEESQGHKIDPSYPLFKSIEDESADDVPEGVVPF